MVEVGGSNPSPSRQFMFTWQEKLGDPKCPYMERWVLDLKFRTIRLHHWFRGDDERHFHDHPWNFWVIVLKGSYYDVTPNGSTFMPRWSISYRPALHKHMVKTDGAWTLLITGPVIRNWGFYVFNKSGKEIWFKAKRYFLKWGHHPCD